MIRIERDESLPTPTEAGLPVETERILVVMEERAHHLTNIFTRYQMLKLLPSKKVALQTYDYFNQELEENLQALANWQYLASLSKQLIVLPNFTSLISQLIALAVKVKSCLYLPVPASHQLVPDEVLNNQLMDKNCFEFLCVLAYVVEQSNPQLPTNYYNQNYRFNPKSSAMLGKWIDHDLQLVAELQALATSETVLSFTANPIKLDLLLTVMLAVGVEPVWDGLVSSLLVGKTDAIHQQVQQQVLYHQREVHYWLEALGISPDQNLQNTQKKRLGQIEKFVDQIQLLKQASELSQKVWLKLTCEPTGQFCNINGDSDHFICGKHCSRHSVRDGDREILSALQLLLDQCPHLSTLIKIPNQSSPPISALVSNLAFKDWGFINFCGSLQKILYF